MQQIAQLPSTSYSKRLQRVAARQATAAALKMDPVGEVKPGKGLARGIVAGLAMEAAVGLGLYALWLGWHLIR
jgi:hypothetical protein